MSITESALETSSFVNHRDPSAAPGPDGQPAASRRGLARAMYACCDDPVHDTHHPDADFRCVEAHHKWTCQTIFAHEVAVARARAWAEREDDEDWA